VRQRQASSLHIAVLVSCPCGDRPQTSSPLLFPIKIMSPPPIAPFPPANLQQTLLPEEWGACLDAWLTLAQIHLRLPDSEFLKTADDEGPLVSFLVSYYRELTRTPNTYLGPKDLSLKRECFLLAHRALSAESIPSSLLQWAFLSDFCHAYPRSKSLRELLQGIWKRKGDYIEGAMHKIKLALTKTLDSGNPAAVENDLGRLCHLLHVSHDAGLLFITGSDFLDSLCVAYSKAAPSLQSKLVTIAYLSLVSLIKSPKPNYSLLSDHLYSLKTSAELEEKSKSGKKLLLADLVTNTPLLSIIKDGVSQQKGARARNIADSLSAFRQAGLARPKKLVRRKVDKGKGRADDEYSHGAFGGVHIYRMSLVSQVQDLFPILGAGFVVKLLNEYNDDVEQVTAHLLDDSLPSYLKNADRTEQMYVYQLVVPIIEALCKESSFVVGLRMFFSDKHSQLSIPASTLNPFFSMPL
jgi:activating signal cointegrator complex subunit 2